MRDLMWISVAAITRNSPATSRFSSCIRSMYSRYCCGDDGDRDVVDVDLVLLDQVQQQVERALEVVEADRIRVEDGFEFLLVSMG